MSGGDKTVTHNKIRDDLYLQARKARTAPQHEAVGIARLLGLEVGRETQERPADVLLCRAQDIRTGGSAGAGKVAPWLPVWALGRISALNIQVQKIVQHHVNTPLPFWGSGTSPHSGAQPWGSVL